MDRRKLPNLVLVLVVIVSLLVGAGGGASAAVPVPDAIGRASAAAPAPDTIGWTFARAATLQRERTAAAAPTNPTDETKIPHYFGPNPNWALSPSTLPDAIVTIAPPGATPVTVGNPLIARANATDYATPPGTLGPVFVVLPTAVLPAGTLQSFQTWNQATPGSSPTPSAGNVFHAYVLRPTGLNQYLVVFDSGLLTVPSVAADQVATFPVAFVVQAGDVIGFYGEGIPVDTGVLANPDIFSYPATADPTLVTNVAPGLGPINLGVDPGFPIYALQDRTYSFAATVNTGSGPGSGATATASVGANGAITGITITNPGSGYTSAPAVAITGAGTNATANAVVTLSGVVTAITVDAPGSGYTAPVVSVSGGGATTVATATANGGVDAVVVDPLNRGTGYTNPTVEFDMPDDPNGTTAKGHATLDASGAVTTIVVDDPGSGYYTAPNVRVYNGTLFDPIACQGPAAAAARSATMKSNDQGKLAPESSAKATVTDSAAKAAAAPAAAASAADCGAIARATLKILSVTVNTYGAGYTSKPTVVISDAPGFSGAGASATATTNVGAVTAINLTAAGSGYITPGGIKKFVDPLPGLCNPAVPGSCPATGKYIPLAVPEAKMYAGVQADEYEIGLVQYRTSFSSSLPPTLVRGYVQLKACTGTPSDIVLANAMLTGPDVPIPGRCGVTAPQWLGPTILATKDKPVRIIFRNLLPTGSGGDLFLPTDSTLMGSGMGPTAMWNPQDLGTVIDGARNPNCTQYPKPDECFKDNRATLHLHGGTSPWISDGTPHQWITPANQQTPWPQGVSVSNVPDMAAAQCDGTTDGCMTFYYTNQQSARLMFYHDHAWGITRLNVYAGEAAGYVISDDTEKALMAGPLASVGLGIPLVIQDRTFVPKDTQLYNQYDAAGNVTSYGQDPTWDASRWGGYGNFWYHHVYMPAQNPGDPGGMSAYGRWMYGPWFWPPAGATTYGPIANPYYGKDPKGPDGKRGTPDDWTSNLATPCNLDVPSTWQYQTDPFCEPQLIPGTPNISTGMEQFNDTPIVNGVAYPTITLEPKSYRFRILSAANDRFFNFQWYVGDPATASTGLNGKGEVIGATEVALNPLELSAAQTDPVVSPSALQSAATAGPDWIQIGTEGGFLPAPVVVDGQQVTTWITDPTRFDVGNVDLHSLLLAPAERADVIVDFSQFAGKTLILYNDAPAAFPARVPSYDYYTGAPDLSPNGAPAILPGYGPNTRTIMQVKIAGTAAPAFNLTALRNAFSHKANGTGVFESGQHPIIVGQAAYNSAYGTNFAAGSNCNVPINSQTTNISSCDGLVRVNDTSVWGFNTLKAPTTRMTMTLEPKAIHDEMNSTTFDEFGRMQANLGIEAQPPTPGVQNVTLYPYVNPQTELIDATNLPKNDVQWSATTGLPVSDVKITPIASGTDGSQIWRITHNGVDTHPIHFHLYDVQVLNRVTWDNIIIPTEPTELGWKDTIRVSPLEDTIVALRPIIPELPWELPNAIRDLSPMMPPNVAAGFNNIDPQGNPLVTPITNQLVNFGWEYVYHCHILSHEEMDMMRPVSVAMPPVKPDTLAFDKATATLSWNDNSIADTAYLVQRMNGTGTWADIGTIQVPLDPDPATPLIIEPNTKGPRSFVDPAYDPSTDYQYRVIAKNTIGYLDGAGPGGFADMTAQSVSDPVTVSNPPKAPTNLTAAYQAGPQVLLTWTDNANNETGFVIQRCEGTGCTNFATIANPGPLTGAGSVTFIDTSVTVGLTYRYQVAATNAVGTSAYSNIVQVGTFVPPAVPTNVTATFQAGTGATTWLPPRVLLSWTDNANNETGFLIERATNGGAFAPLATAAANATTFVDTTIRLPGTLHSYRVAANAATGPSAWSTPAATVTTPNFPAAPTIATIVGNRQGNSPNDRVTLTWNNVAGETGYTLQRSTNANFTAGLVTTNLGANATSYTTDNVPRNTTFYFRIRAYNAVSPSAWSPVRSVLTP